MDPKDMERTQEILDKFDALFDKSTESKDVNAFVDKLDALLNEYTQKIALQQLHHMLSMYAFNLQFTLWHMGQQEIQ